MHVRAWAVVELFRCSVCQEFLAGALDSFLCGLWLLLRLEGRWRSSAARLLRLRRLCGCGGLEYAASGFGRHHSPSGSPGPPFARVPPWLRFGGTLRGWLRFGSDFGAAAPSLYSDLEPYVGQAVVPFGGGLLLLRGQLRRRRLGAQLRFEVCALSFAGLWEAGFWSERGGGK